MAETAVTESQGLLGSEEENLSLDSVLDVPVEISVVLGRTALSISELLKVGPGYILELDRKVGEAVDVFVNNRLVARGEVVIVEENVGITMTEIFRAEK